MYFAIIFCQDHFVLGLSQCPSEESSLSISTPAITLSPGISNNVVAEEVTRQQNETDSCSFLHFTYV